FEYLFLARGERLFQTQHPFYVFVVAAIIHPLYIVVMGFLGRFVNFKWKEEIYTAQTHEERRSPQDQNSQPAY
ncbi:MAG TPA: hypothetical protein VGA99_03905, partial [bacterium]